MDQLTAKRLLNREFPVSIRSLMAPAVTRAYLAVEHTVDTVDYLKGSQRGNEMRRYLRNVAVEFELKDLAHSKKIPFKCVETKNAAKNCHHLELHSNHFILTISQVPLISDLPREAVFRNNHSLSNCFSLFPECSTPAISEKHYIVLTHGYHGIQPDFVAIGVPEPYITAWAAQVVLLHKQDIAMEQPSEEKVPEKTTSRLKQHLLEGLNKYERSGDE